MFDVTAPPARAALPAVVVRLDLQAGRRHLVADVLVAAGVFADAVDEQDRRPRRPRPGAARLGLVGRPVPDEKVRAVGCRGVADDGRHDGRVRDRRATYPAESRARI